MQKFVQTDKQLACTHIRFVTTKENQAYIGINSDDDTLNVYGGIVFTYCPICGAQLKEEN